MSYYLGDETFAARPITTGRPTEIRKAYDRKTVHAHLCRYGRRPLNRQSYPVSGVPVSGDGIGNPDARTQAAMIRNAFKGTVFFGGGQLNGVEAQAARIRAAYKGSILWGGGQLNDASGLGDLLPWGMALIPGSRMFDRASASGPSTWTRSSGIGIPGSLSGRRKPGSGRSRGGLGDAGDFSLGASILDPIAPFAPSFSSSLVTTSAPTPSGGGLFDSIMNLWDSRPDALKAIRIRVKPQQVAAVAQRLVKPGQVQSAVDYARAYGLDPSMLTMAGEVPITGTMAGQGYRIAGIDIGQYLPWIIGGGVALLVLPMVLGKR